MKTSGAILFNLQNRNAAVSNLDAVTKSILDRNAESQPVSMIQVQQLSEAVDENLDFTQNSNLIFLKSKALIHEGNGYAGLKCYIDFITLNPTDMNTQLRLRDVLKAALSLLESKLDKNISDLGIGPMFELLQLHGYIGCEHQVMMVRHYNCIGEYKKAANLALGLAKTQPMIPILQDEIQKTLTGLKESELQKFVKPMPIPVGVIPTKSDLTLAETKALIDVFNSAQFDPKDRSQMLSALKKIETVIGTDFRYFDQSFKLLYYHKGIILDYLERPFEAIAIFYALRYFDPADTSYQTSFRIACQRLYSYLIEISQKNPRSPEIERGYQILKDSYRVDYKLIQAYATYLYSIGQQERARQVLTDLIDLNSYDYDYMMSALISSESGKDEQMIELVMSRVSAMQKRAPWILAFIPASDTPPVPKQSVANHQ